MVQQFDTIFFEVVFEYNSEHTGVLLAETTFSHGVAATSCGSHVLFSMGMEMETGESRVVSCLDNC